jgi:ribosomal protein L16 Arg81 hydroxylase
MNSAAKVVFQALDPQSFFLEAWGKQAVLVDLPNAIEIPFSLDAFEDLLLHRNLRYPQVRCSGPSGPIEPILYTRSTTSRFEPEIDPVRVIEHAQRGVTVRINRVCEIYPPLRCFASDVAACFDSPVRINAYYTRGPNEGVRGHYDSHHVFAIQLVGTKIWRVGPIVVDTPTTEFHPYPAREPDVDKELNSFPGSILYLPPGIWHSTRACGVSLHLSVGIHPPTWTSELRRLIDFSMKKHPILRSALPLQISPGGCKHRRDVASEIKRLLSLLESEIGDWERAKQKANATSKLPRSPGS